MKKLYTVNEVAEMLHVSPKTVRYWAQHGKISYFKVGCLVRFDEDQIRSMLDKREAKKESNI